VDGGWRYSQAQIQDLAAHPIPRFSEATQSFSSVERYARRVPEKSDADWVCEKHFSGAKARTVALCAMRGLKPPPPSVFVRRLKSSLLSVFGFSTAGQIETVVLSPIHRQFISGAGDGGAVALKFVRRQINQASQRRIGGHRNH
jgi:hypothetical protein